MEIEQIRQIPTTSDLLEKATRLMNTLHCVSVSLSLQPDKPHHVNFINYIDLQEMRKEFVDSLFATTTRFVYSKAKYGQKERTYLKDSEPQDAHTFIQQEALSTFRVKYPKGQFSELILFNLLQHHFRAVPLVRKMPITTSTDVERFGADAIHIRIEDDKKINLFLGESKTYESGFKPALKKSLASLIDTYSNYRNELNLYKHNEFLAPELTQIAEDFLDGKLTTAEVHLVSLISYEREEVGVKASRQEIIDAIIESVKAECLKIKATDYPDLQKLPMFRLDYVILPFGGLEQLLNEFSSRF